MTPAYLNQAQAAKRSMLLTALYVAQQQFGYLSNEAIQRVAERLDMTAGDVYHAATFYSLFRALPVGRYLIHVCDGLSCHLSGGAEPLCDYLKERLGIGVGETTKDGLFTLQTVPCLAACDQSPAMRINDTLYTTVTNDQVDLILQDLRGA
jgi:NADH-quinone oxidoreductase subunit E